MVVQRKIEYWLEKYRVRQKEDVDDDGNDKRPRYESILVKGKKDSWEENRYE